MTWCSSFAKHVVTGTGRKLYSLSKVLARLAHKILGISKSGRLLFFWCVSACPTFLSSSPITTKITQADDSYGSKAFSSVCVCLFVCLFVRTTRPKWLQLQSPNLPQWYSIKSPRPAIIRSEGQRSRSQGHKVQKRRWSGRLELSRAPVA